MYTRILVPLDGSKLAECVFPHVEAIASGCGTQKILLVSVTERLKVKEKYDLPAAEEGGYHVLHGTDFISGQVIVPMNNSFMADSPATKATWMREIGRFYNEADRYLDRVQRSLIKKGLDVETAVLLGNPAEAIVAYATKNEVDLIIMASHGRSGISRWASGSTTDRVFRSSCVPVLMVRAPGCIPGF